MDTDTCRCSMCENLFSLKYNKTADDAEEITVMIKESELIENSIIVEKWYCLEYGNLMSTKAIQQNRKCEKFSFLGKDNE